LGTHFAKVSFMHPLAHFSTRFWHNGALIAATVLAVTLDACGGQVSSSNFSADSGTGDPGANDDAAAADAADEHPLDSSGMDVAMPPDSEATDTAPIDVDAIAPPGPCAPPPVGTWTVTYARQGNGPLACGLAQTSTLHVVEADGGVSLDYQPCEVASGGAECLQSGTFDPGRCAIRATTSSMGMAGGERQCVTRDLTLLFHGDFAEGTMVYTKCWCSTYPPVMTTYLASAARRSSKEHPDERPRVTPSGSLSRPARSRW
jgi:hypothetical protein